MYRENPLGVGVGPAGEGGEGVKNARNKKKKKKGRVGIIIRKDVRSGSRRKKKKNILRLRELPTI